MDSIDPASPTSPASPDSTRAGQADLVATVRSSLVWASGPARHQVRTARRQGDLVTIARGVHLPLELLADGAPPWQWRRVVDVARLVVVHTALPDDVVFCRGSALVLLGVATLDPPDGIDAVTVGRQDRLRAGLPAVTARGLLVAQRARVRLHHGADEAASPLLVSGIPTSATDEVVIGTARFADSRAAVASVSVLLHDLTRFDRRRIEESRQRESAVKARLHQRLATSPRMPRGRRAGAIIDASDAACESVAEASMVWFLHAHGARPWLTQCELVVNGRSYFPDFLFPDQRVLLEVEGFAKLGKSEQDVRRNAMRQFDRGSELEAQGWRVVHVPATLALGPPAALAAHLRRVAPEIFDPTATPSAFLRR